MIRFFLLTTIIVTTFAQKGVSQDMCDTLNLDEIRVVEKISFTKIPCQTILNLTQLKKNSAIHQTLSEALEQSTAINVRSYGTSGISTISVRGAGASHTGVVWNGVNIQNFQNGQFDFSTLPLGAADRIILIQGGTGAQVGSGSIGGTVFIDNEIDFGKTVKAEIGMNAGMFGQFAQQALAEKQSKRFSTRITVLNSVAENNFTYVNANRFGSPVDTIRNGAFVKQSVLSSSKLKTGTKSALNLHLWLNKQHTEDPGNMSVPAKGHFTDNENIRSAVHWAWENNHLSFDIRSAFLYGYMKYAGDITANHFTNNQINEISLGRSGNLIPWKMSVVRSTEWINSSDLVAAPMRNRYSVYGIAKYPWKKVEIAMVARQEVVDKEFIPFTPALGINYQINRRFSTGAFSSRSYRLPSFNDLYWTGWGNPNLTAEDALNNEISLKFDSNTLRNVLRLRLTAFNNHIKNMIVWQPQGSIWTPENTDRVRTYGLEVESSYQSKMGEFIKYGLQTQYAWTKSISGGFQMLYVPEHKGVINLEASIKGYYLTYNHMLTSFRYANKENTIYVDGFHVANLGVGKSLTFSNYNFKLAATVKNLYNASYQVIRFYPSPPRSFEISVSISYKHIKT